MPVPSGYRPIPGSERVPLRNARRIRPAEPHETLSVSIHLRRRSDGPPMPSLDHWAKTPLGQRNYVTRAQFAARYGAAPQDLDAVTSFAHSHGLAVTETSAARRTITVSGTVAQMEGAFGVSLGQYESPTETYRGREGPVHIPEHLIDIVESVLGLDNRRIARHHATASGLASGDAAEPGAGPAGASAMTPVQVAKLYNFPTSSATGQTIAIIELGGGYVKSDIKAFFDGLSLTTPTLVDVSVDGATNSPAGSLSNVTGNDADIEVALDIDVAGAIAQGAKIAMYFAPNTEQGFADAVTTAAQDTTNAPFVISCSWSGSEDGWSSSGRNTMSQALIDAASLGVTMFVDSGDFGSDGNVGDGSAHVFYPPSDPGVTGCGGTFIANVSGSTFTEGTWNDVGATGGGVSDVIGLPAWQDGAGIPVSANDGKTVGRGVPDVSGNASPFSGYTLTLYGKLTTSLIITSGTGKGGTVGTIGGTSAVAPLYAGLLAMIEAQIGEPLGFLNPVFYALANSGVFKDINDGANNQWSGEAKTAPSYTCGAGWDACTGIGRIDGTALLNALQQVFAKRLSFIIDESTFGQDEVEVQLPGTASFANAYWIAVDGFRPHDLGLDAGNLNAPPAASIPSVGASFDPSLSTTEVAALQAMLSAGTFAPPVVPQDPSLPNVPQRFLFPFTIAFHGDGGFQAMRNATPALTTTLVTLTGSLTAVGTSVTNSAEIELTTGEDPRFEDVDPQNPAQASWLSFDLRFFKMTVPSQGSASRFGATVTGAADAPAFIAKAWWNSLNSSAAIPSPACRRTRTVRRWNSSSTTTMATPSSTTPSRASGCSANRRRRRRMSASSSGCSRPRTRSAISIPAPLTGSPPTARPSATARRCWACRTTRTASRNMSPSRSSPRRA